MKTSDLTPEQKRVKIAAHCGFRDIQTEESGKDSMGVRDGEYHFLPRYLDDLNAMHEAVRAAHQKGDQFFFREYQMNLFRVVCPGFNEEASLYRYSFCQYEMTEATAAQRAEAFLLTI